MPNLYSNFAAQCAVGKLRANTFVPWKTEVDPFCSLYFALPVHQTLLSTRSVVQNVLNPRKKKELCEDLFLHWRRYLRYFKIVFSDVFVIVMQL